MLYNVIFCRIDVNAELDEKCNHLTTLMRQASKHQLLFETTLTGRLTSLIFLTTLSVDMTLATVN